jgi:dienelactone hydrolase
MSILSRPLPLGLLAAGLIVDSLPVSAATFEPLFDTVETYSTEITLSEDPADIYYPVSDGGEEFPVALLLQGALVDKSDYSEYASQVASYGFVVVVPNNERTVIGPTGEPFTGLLAEQQQINEVLTYLEGEDVNPDSPISGIVDPNRLGLLGHSFGGAVGIGAIADTCFVPLCDGEFTPPEALMAGAFYGAGFVIPQAGGTPPIDNGDVPIALIIGTEDGVEELADVQRTYEQIQQPPKALVTVLGANHYGITNEDSPRDPLRPTLPQDEATQTIAQWSGLFLRAHVLDDEAAFDYIYNTGDDRDPNVEVVSQVESVPEPASIMGLIAIGVLGIGLGNRGLASRGAINDR